MEQTTFLSFLYYKANQRIIDINILKQNSKISTTAAILEYQVWLL